MSSKTTTSEVLNLMQIKTIIWRSLRLKCYHCGIGNTFRSWFKMVDNCSHCDVTFEREPGFFLGSIYINYAFTALTMTSMYIPALILEWAPNNQLIWYAFAYTIITPILLFRHARSLWLGFDQLFDPQQHKSDGKGHE